ncbi:glucuronate isomerase [Jeotgalibaca ciconiae]|uniref:Uronate isomerase n=1 Tax=Jeotgalibaca ciconiae TaxID=2496265 RepID=A0A3S9H960_9LACT|nr:glucuronate isomerase [Jeotgalibaca ciconiae]AZP03884.1 glucuronate isomerase [Jeotgalibaca ciconiae]HJB24826.1 glucuronate isomerase [Candidatus Jeotgalibaca pullicola]
MSFIHDNFMLQSETAQRLYHDFSKDMPIFDYHCHLSPQQIAEDHKFKNVTELWLGGDHYKWRAMRAMGIDEEKITGNASDEEKFEAWAYACENAVGNPLFHWSALELKRYFHIDELLTSKNWKEIYDKCNQVIEEENLTARKLIKNSNVTFVCTTDNPTDDLAWHKQIAEDDSFDVKVAPGFRPDEAFAVQDAAKFTNFLGKMREVTGRKMDNFADLLAGLEERIQYFADCGSNISDHGLSTIHYVEASDEEIEAIFQKAANSEAVSHDEYTKFQTKLLVELGKIYHAKDFVMQLHFGAIRNNNRRIFAKIGPDAGVDSIQDQPNVSYALNNLMGAMDENNQLPKFIMYPLDPTYFDLAGTAAANFQMNSEGIKSKVQLGSGWWFNDTKYGMLKQLKALSEAGLLMNFVGMLTDSRSFISYTRHEYFRRILCDFIGDLVERGEIPDDDALLEKLIKNISYDNAVEYFNFNK